jgi:ABC-type uncharacterized transport system permease subunit
MSFQILISAVLITYILLTFWQAAYLFKLANNKKYPLSLFIPISLMAIITHGYLLYEWIEMGGGQNLQLVNLLALTPWCMNILVLLFFTMGRPILSLTMLSYPLSCITILLAYRYTGLNTHILHTRTEPYVLAHILLSITAVSLILLAALQSTLLGLQIKLLKYRPASGIKALLPPLETMERFLFTILQTGWIMLVFSLLTGFLSGYNPFSPAVFPKTGLSLLAFIFISLLLIGKKYWGWRGIKAVKFTFISTILLIFAYFGTKTLVILY